MTKPGPTCGNHPVPARPNHESATAISVPNHLLPALVDALAIARNRALMCGEPHLKSGMEALRQDVFGEIPDSARSFSSGAWAACLLCIQAGDPIESRASAQGPSWRASWRVEIFNSRDEKIIARSEELETEERATQLCKDLQEIFERERPLS